MPSPEVAVWRCSHPDGDVKYAVREAHVEVLEQRGYTCVLDPDAQYDEHDTMVGNHGPTS